jgi:hypothetical protein
LADAAGGQQREIANIGAHVDEGVARLKSILDPVRQVWFPNAEHVDIALYEVLGGSGYFEAESSFGLESVWSEPLIDVERYRESPCALVP